MPRNRILSGEAEPRTLAEQSRMARGTYSPRDPTAGLAGAVNRAVQHAVQPKAAVAALEAKAEKAKRR